MQGRDPEGWSQSSSGYGALAVLACLLLGGCALLMNAPPTGSARRPVQRPAATAPTVATGPRYQLDDARSELRILAYRDGALARFGHNHVLLARDMKGEFVPGDDRHPGTFQLRLPIAALRIDESAARAAAGAEFESVPSAADIEGTRRHLLGPDQLDAERYPELRVTGTLDGPATGLTAHALIEVRGVATSLDVPVAIRAAADGSVVASGEFRVQQTRLGLIPYSVALGALQVRDELAVRFTLVGSRGGDAVPATH